MSATGNIAEKTQAVKAKKADLSFDQLMEIYNHIGEEERHFNTLEMEYRKLASQWLLVSLGAIGFILSKQELVPINIWALVIGICMAASVGILVLWLLDLKVYHELLHGAFREGVLLENEFEILPQIRNNMVKSQSGGDIISKVILYYFFSILLLIVIANISVWLSVSTRWICIVCKRGVCYNSTNHLHDHDEWLIASF